MRNPGNITVWQGIFLLLVTYFNLAYVAGGQNLLTDPAATGLVDVDTVYQELEGFGASGAWYENWLTAHPLRQEIFDVLFGDLGLDIYRVRNAYDIDNSNIIQSAYIVQAAKTRNPMIKVMISSWSPPAYLKSNDNTVGGTLKKNTYDNYMYDEFAQWWADSLAEYSKRGIDIEYVNMQNEPDYEASWDSCVFAPTETTSRAGYNLAFEALYAELNDMANFTKLLAPEACGLYATANYINALIDDSHAYGWAHHLYAGGRHNAPDGYIPAMANFAIQYGHKPILQTEFAKGDSSPLTFTDAMNLAILMHNSLTVEGASGYLYWELFWTEPKGLVSIDNPWGWDPGYTINSVYYAFKHYSAFTDPGWHRVEASTDSSGLRISAFTSPDVNELAIVIINDSDVGINLALSLGDFSPISSEIYRTSETENTAYIGTFDESQSMMFPSQTITTISLTGAISPKNCAEVQAAGFGLTSDISGDCYVNYKDLEIIAECWLTEDYSKLSGCQGAELDMLNDVDLIDFAMFAEEWLQCNDPEDPDCIPNW